MKETEKHPDLKLRGFLNELRRRQVFGTVALYSVAAWAVIEVGDMAIESGFFTGLTTRGLFILAVIGFPLVLLAGWFYDVTKKGVFRTPPTGADESFDNRLQTRDYSFLLVLLAIWGGAYVYVYTPPLVEKSIAVMPFDWCQENPSDPALAGGIHAAVIDKLALQDQLKVISRSAIYNLAGVGITPDRVANTYHVQYLLNGELCRDGTDLLMRAELTDNDHVIAWNGNFRQSVNRLNQVEQQLATVTAEGIARELGEVADIRYAEPIKVAPAKPIDALALEKLRIGQYYRQQDDNEKAREAFEEALEREPEYAEALYELSLVTQVSDKSIIGGIRKAKPIAERALTAARADIGQGVNDYKPYWVAAKILDDLSDWERNLTWRIANTLTSEQIEANKASAQSMLDEAEQYLREAIRLNPSEPELRKILWVILYRQGFARREEAFEVLQQARIIEPLNEFFATRFARSLAGRGQYHQAMEELDRFEVLGEVPWRVRSWQLEIQQQGFRAYDDKLELLVEMLQHETGKFTNPYIFGQLYWCASNLAVMGLNQEAEALYQSLAAVPIPEDDEDWAWARKVFLEDMYRQATASGEERARERLAEVEGMSNEEILDQRFSEAQMDALAFWTIGETERAIQIFEAFEHMELERWSFTAKAHLIEFYVTTGRKAEAAPLLDEVTSGFEQDFEAGNRNPEFLEALAEFYALKGEDEDALRMLELAVDYGYWAWLEDGAGDADPEDRGSVDRGFIDAFQALNGDPRFERQKRRAQALARQKADNIRSLLAEYDIDALLAPVIEMRKAAVTSQD